MDPSSTWTSANYWITAFEPIHSLITSTCDQLQEKTLQTTVETYKLEHFCLVLRGEQVFVVEAILTASAAVHRQLYCTTHNDPLSLYLYTVVLSAIIHCDCSVISLTPLMMSPCLHI